MKYALLCLCFFLTCCDDTDIEVQTIKCGLAISEVGNEQAKNNFLTHGNMPHIMADIFLLEEKAKDELGMYSDNQQQQRQLIIEEYNSWFCRNIHAQAKIALPTRSAS